MGPADPSDDGTARAEIGRHGGLDRDDRAGGCFSDDLCGQTYRSPRVAPHGATGKRVY